jgi:hypothetical protein
VTPRRKAPPDQPQHPIDWGQANHFHELIHGDLETEYRLINATGRTISKWGDLLDVNDPTHPALAELQRLNDAGYGAYAVINHPDPTVADRIRAGKGSTGDDDITAATALFVDIDREETRPGENLALLEDAEVPPSLIVQSSAPHKVHGYWLVDDLTDLALWRRLQVQLIAHFGADPVCRNPSRIMRIPGFWHHKQEPVQTRLVTAPGTTYSTLELIELFNLDPELDTEPPAVDLPDGYTPPAVELLLNRPFTRRMTHKVHQTDKGRHNTILWWAQHLRENGIAQDDALQSAAPFAAQLPDRHVEGPIPPDEVIDAINWAYAKGAGRNKPVRQTGLETVAVNGGDQGNGSGGNDDDLDEVTAASARAPITIQAGGYAKVRDTREGPVFTQLTNWTFTPTLALRWPDGSTGHRGTLTVNTTHRHTIDIPAKAWASRRDLLATISSYDAVIFANSNSDVAHIRQFILTNHPGLPIAHGVSTYGLHRINAAWEQLYEDTHHPKIFYAGTPVDPGPAYRAPSTGTQQDIEAARNTIALLPRLITPAAALALLGYAMASAYAPRITPALGDRLPFLYITGERESGKSSSIELVLALATGHPSARLRKATGLTAYQYDSAYANLNNRLAALDEYRPGSIDDAQLRKHHDLGSKYRGSGIAGKEHAYHLNSPLIVAGEGFTEDAAALSRGPLYFIEKRHRGSVDTYLRAQAAPNHAYAQHLANAAATLTEPAHTARLEHARNLADSATKTRGGPRLQFAMTFTAYGLLHLQDDGLHDLFTDAAIQRALEVGVTQTLDGGEESKTNLEIFLEQLGVTIGEAKDPHLYLVPGYVTSTVIIRMSAAVEAVKRRYARDAAIANARLLRQYAQKLPWVDASDTHKAIGSLTTRGIRIDLNKAPDRCDLGALQYLEQKLRSEHR